MAAGLPNLTAFFLHLDELKGVQRRTYVGGGERRENSAEHSWQLAMACWCFAETLKDDFDVDHLIKLALVHDLGEIGAGDTFLYSESRNNAHIIERQSVEKTAAFPGNAIPNLLALWDEQESGETKESRLLKVIDRLLPFLHNIASEGKAWRENGIRKSQVLNMHGFIEHEQPEVWSWLTSKIDFAVERGWLDAS
ncbi:MAG: HD domain-containing protein [Pseudomonadota bacterium]